MKIPTTLNVSDVTCILARNVKTNTSSIEEVLNKYMKMGSMLSTNALTAALLVLTYVMVGVESVLIVLMDARTALPTVNALSAKMVSTWSMGTALLINLLLRHAPPLVSPASAQIIAHLAEKTIGYTTTLQAPF